MSAHDAMDCSRMLDELQDVLRGEATPETADAVRKHLDACTPCLKYVAFEGRFLELLKSCGGKRIPEDVRERLLKCIRSGG
ncbi:MAG TPA: zf-HC2 domain-containing protein [Gemmatimonadales bacterium]|nr:zf-HC2 domain-containing protein [Gemmatimonadales bacterium]